MSSTISCIITRKDWELPFSNEKLTKRCNIENVNLENSSSILPLTVKDNIIQALEVAIDDSQQASSSHDTGEASYAGHQPLESCETLVKCSHLKARIDLVHYVSFFDQKFDEGTAS